MDEKGGRGIGNAVGSCGRVSLSSYICVPIVDL